MSTALVSQDEETAPELVECPNCEGAGWIQTTVDDGPECPDCKGEGVVEADS